MGGLGKKTEKEYVLIKTSNTLNPAPPARAFGPNANKTLMFVDKEYNLLANHSYVFEVKALRKEYIAVAGCPYDKSEKNKLLFPAQAVRMMRLLQGRAPDFKAAKKDSDCLITKQGHKLTILLMNVPVDDKQKEYTDEQLAVVAESCTAYDVDFIEMDNLTELIGYINNTNRESYLVEELTFFSHGRPSVLGEMPPDNKDVFGIALGDGTAQKHALNFNSEQGIKLQGAAFSADAEIKAFACRTGTGVYDSDKVEPLDPSGVPGGGGGLNWKTEVSQAQTMANAIRRVMWAYVCKSDYEDTWGSKVDRAQYWGFCPQFDPAVPVDSNDFSFCIQFGKLDNERRENIGKINANWNSIGALYSVKAGDNPANAPKDYRMFIPR